MSGSGDGFRTRCKTFHPPATGDHKPDTCHNCRLVAEYRAEDPWLSPVPPPALTLTAVEVVEELVDRAFQ